ncbi:methyl-accepting chemotaxis protein [Bacteriovoracales bacterium]|nr:methyl-accepting chemotaxis protein [Bacteriovoracales bacterium]
MTLFQMYAEYKSAKTDILGELKVTKKSFVRGLTEAVWNLDNNQTQYIGEGIFDLPLIKAVIVYDHKDKILFSKLGKAKKESEIKNSSEGFFSYEFPLLKMDKDGKKIGTVKLFSNQWVVLDRVKLGYLILVIVAILKTILLFVLFFWVFKKRLIEPITSLADQAENINFDELNEVSLDLKNKKRNELNILEESINRMVKGLELSKKETLESYEKIKYMNKKLEDNNFNLEESIKDRVKEISEYMDNMKSAVFSIDSNLKVLNPVSSYALNLFGRDIAGENVLKVLFSHLQPGSREFIDLTSCFGLTFGADSLQFLMVENNFPKKVKIFRSGKKGESTLKVTYSPLMKSDDKIHKLMIIVEDITKYESHYKGALNDQIKFNYIKELLSKKSKVKIVKLIEESIKESMDVLEDFISPISDTYSKEYFVTKTIELIRDLSSRLKDIESLSESIDSIIPDLTGWKNHLLTSERMNPQLEATEKVCEVIEQMSLCAQAFSTVTPFIAAGKIEFKIKEGVIQFLADKKADIDKVYKNILEYIFLIRTIDQIDDKKLVKAVGMARLYPNFKETMNLIYQRSKYISFIYKIQMNIEGADKYGHLASMVKGMPIQEALSATDLKYGLIDPYVDILEMNVSKD